MRAVRAATTLASSAATRSNALRATAAVSRPHGVASTQLLVRCATTAATTSTATTNKKGGKYDWAVTDIPPPSPGRGFIGRSANFDVTQRAGSLDRWDWLLRLLGFMNEDDRLYRHSTCLFQSCANQTALPAFYRALGLKPDFRAQQALLMAHVWLVHRRLALEGADGKVMQELVFDRLWEETVVRIRYLNVSELTVNKHLAEVQQVGFNACIAYDAGLKDTPAAFHTAIAKHLLENETPAGLRIASVLGDYLKRELKSLERVEMQYIVEGTVPWGQPPPAAAVDSDSDSEYTLIGQQIGNWRTALDNRGKLYYWNITTRFSVWDKPTGDALFEGLESVQQQNSL